MFEAFRNGKVVSSALSAFARGVLLYLFGLFILIVVVLVYAKLTGHSLDLSPIQIIGAALTIPPLVNFPPLVKVLKSNYDQWIEPTVKNYPTINRIIKFFPLPRVGNVLATLLLLIVVYMNVRDNSGGFNSLFDWGITVLGLILFGYDVYFNDLRVK